MSVSFRSLTTLLQHARLSQGQRLLPELGAGVTNNEARDLAGWFSSQAQATSGPLGYVEYALRTVVWERHSYTV